MKKQTALVITPGRGAYQADELGYLQKYHSDKHDFIGGLDALRHDLGQTPITELDQAKRFVRSRHTNGENASLLIFACAMADFMAIDRNRYDIVAIAGNSMGWYLTLACAGALPGIAGARLVNHMGTLMHEKGVGGQILYPIVDDQWKLSPERIELVDTAIKRARHAGHEAFMSIHLGGTAVIAGDGEAINFLKKDLPALDRFPMELAQHAAFHTPLLNFISVEAKSTLPVDDFQQPHHPMIDGRGHIWSPGASEISALYDYTLGTQITDTYDFTKSVEVGISEYAPEKIIILGPGPTMGPPVAQTLIAGGWYGIRDKATFKKRQAKDPIILSMGIEDQRTLVTS